MVEVPEMVGDTAAYWLAEVQVVVKVLTVTEMTDRASEGVLKVD